MYYTRTIEKVIKEIKEQYCIISIYGARQVGKSTMVNHVFNNFNSVSLDNLEELLLAKSNPKLFLEKHAYPLIIDEIQKAPELLSEIKLIVDKYKYNCLENNKQIELLYVLTGSNQFELQKGISESLAGRTAILNLSSFSKNEFLQIDTVSEFIPYIELLKTKKFDVEKLYRNRYQIFDDIFLGGMPDYVINNLNRDAFFNSYIQTYIEKDIKKVIAVNREREFLQLLEYLAFRTGQQINFIDASRTLGIDYRTVKEWMSILISSGIIILLPPFSNNISSRLTKTPKLYFLDTGLCSFLCKWPNSSSLEKGSMSGAFYETYIVSEIIKSFYNVGKRYDLNICYYRDKDSREVDLIFEYSDYIIPVEIKKGVNPVSSTYNFSFLNKFNKEVKTGIILDSRKDLFPVNNNVWYCPIYMIGI